MIPPPSFSASAIARDVRRLPQCAHRHLTEIEHLLVKLCNDYSMSSLGYVQGLHVVAAGLVLRREKGLNEGGKQPIDDFREIVRSLDGLYSEGMPLVHESVIHVKMLLLKHVRDVYDHWMALGIDLITILPNGLLTLFSQWFGLETTSSRVLGWILKHKYPGMLALIISTLRLLKDEGILRRDFEGTMTWFHREMSDIFDPRPDHVSDIVQKAETLWLPVIESHLRNYNNGGQTREKMIAHEIPFGGATNNPGPGPNNSTNIVSSQQQTDRDRTSRTGTVDSDQTKNYLIRPGQKRDARDQSYLQSLYGGDRASTTIGTGTSKQTIGGGGDRASTTIGTGTSSVSVELDRIRIEELESKLSAIQNEAESAQASLMAERRLNSDLERKLEIAIREKTDIQNQYEEAHKLVQSTTQELCEKSNQEISQRARIQQLEVQLSAAKRGSSPGPNMGKSPPSSVQDLRNQSNNNINQGNISAELSDDILREVSSFVEISRSEVDGTNSAESAWLKDVEKLIQEKLPLGLFYRQYMNMLQDKVMQLRNLSVIYREEKQEIERRLQLSFSKNEKQATEIEQLKTRNSVVSHTQQAQQQAASQQDNNNSSSNGVLSTAQAVKLQTELDTVARHNHDLRVQIADLEGQIDVFRTKQQNIDLANYQMSSDLGYIRGYYR